MYLLVFQAPNALPMNSLGSLTHVGKIIDRYDDANYIYHETGFEEKETHT